MPDWKALPNAPKPGQALGTLKEIGPGGREFMFGRGLAAFRMFVVRLEGNAVRGYVNRCPHYSLPLNHQADEFLTRDRSRIMCRQHLALFDLNDGVCIDGACEGNGLTLVEVTVSQGQLAIA